ncbi:MAG: MFS transporter [Dehalococcoidia bacterium]
MPDTSDRGRVKAVATDDAPPAEHDELPPLAEMGMFFAFRYAGYRWLWLGNALSSGAQWIQQTTMGWVVFDVTGSGAMLGAIIGVGNLASPFVSPLAGLAADRIKRSHVVAVSQFLLFVNALALAMALRTGSVHVWNLFAFAIGASVLNGFNMPARQSMVFDVVPREVGPNAVALSNIAFNVMRSVGPAIGGALILLFGPSNNFMVQAVAYLLVIVTVLRIRLPERPAGAARRQSFMRDMVEGYRWVVGSPAARILLLMMVIYPLFIIPVHNALMVIFARDIFGAGAAGLGVLLSALGVGGLIGGLLTAALNRVDRRGVMQLYALWACGGFLAVFAVIGGLTGQFWLGVAMLVLSGIGGSIFNTTNQTVVQLIAPNHLRGRITSVLQVQPLCMAAGTLITGAAADRFGAVAVGTADGLLALGVGLLVFACSSRMRSLRLSQLVEASNEEAARAVATQQRAPART